MDTRELEARELDYRENDGISVLLLWHPATDSLSISVHDETTDEVFEIDVDARNALDAFRHPYAYFARGRRELVAH
jgi:hypothetical protein